MAKSSFSKKPAASAPAKASPAKAPAKAAAPPPRATQAAAPAKTMPKAPPGVRTNAGSPPAPRSAPPRAPARLPSSSRHPAPPAEDVQPHDEVVDNTDRAIVEAPSAAVGLMNVPLGGSAGAMSQSDFAIPKLSIVQGIGPLFEAGFEPGTIVLNGAACIYGEGCDPLELTILRYVKQFVENLPYGSEEFPRIFATPEEAEAAGLSTQWGPNSEKPDVLPQLLCMVMVKDPGNLDDDQRAEFTAEFGDSLFAPAMWRLNGTAYPLVKVITNAQRTRLQAGLHTGSFLLSTKKVTSTKGKATFNYFVPQLQPGSAHAPEFIDFLAQNA